MDDKLLRQRTTPLFSVVVATRNAGAVLPMTLESLLTQTYKDFEVLLIDALSSDTTIQIAQSFSGLSMSVVSEADAGISDAWNKGVRRAAGAWITFLNAGDLLHPRHFERAMAQVVKHGSDAIYYCDVFKFSGDGTLSNKILGRAPTRAGVGMGSVGFGHPGSIVSTSLIAQIGGFDTRYKIAIDSDFLLRCHVAGVAFRRFESAAYMGEGGVSDMQFYRAMTEYFDAASRLGLVTPFRAKFAPRFLAGARSGLHLIRRFAMPSMRTLKHATIACLNRLLDVLPQKNLRRAALRMLGFDLRKGASVGMGFRFYNLGKIVIGKNSVINRNCLMDNRADIHIGENASVSRNVEIFTAGHDIHSPFFEMVTSPVVIRDHVVIFAGARIMPGVTIGSGAVVYAAAVVTRDVPDMAIVAGNPAREIGKRASVPRYRLQYEYPLAM